MINEESVHASYISMAWPSFEQKLAATLGYLKEDQFLILSLKRSNRFVQFAAQGSFGMRIETTSNSYLPKAEQLDKQQISTLIDIGWIEPTGKPSESTPEYDPDGSPNFFMEFSVPVSFEAVANLAIRTLAEILRVPHPGFLQYGAFDAEENEIALPTLGLKQAERTAQDENEGAIASQLLALLRGLTHIADLDFNEHGYIGFCAGNLPMFVAIANSQTYIRVGSPIHSGLFDTTNVLALLNDINFGIYGMHFYLRDETVYGVIDIPALPFVSEHIVRAIGQIRTAAKEMSETLQEQFGRRSERLDCAASSTCH